MEVLTLLSAIATATDSSVVQVADKGCVTLQLIPSGYTGTVTFQAKFADASGWVAVAGVKASDLSTKSTNAAFTTSNATEIWYVPVRGLAHFRVSATHSAGTLTVLGSVSASGVSY